MAEERAIALDKLARALDKLRDTGLPLNDWQAGKKYKVNYPVLHENKIYRCKEAHIASSTFDETKWETVSNADTVVDTYSGGKYYAQNELVIYNGGLYIANQNIELSSESFNFNLWSSISCSLATNAQIEELFGL